MSLDTPQPDGSSRLRLVDVRVDAERGHLHLRPHLSGVLTAPADRSDAPLDRDDGRRTEARTGGRLGGGRRRRRLGLGASGPTAPGELSDPDRPRRRARTVAGIVGPAATSSPPRTRRGGSRATGSTPRSSGRGIGFRFPERRSDRSTPLVIAPRPVRAPEPVPEPKVEAAPEPESEVGAEVEVEVEAPGVDWAKPPDATTHIRRKLRTLVTALDAMKPVPLPEGALLAAAWDAHATLPRARAAADEDACRGRQDRSARAARERSSCRDRGELRRRIR